MAGLRVGCRLLDSGAPMPGGKASLMARRRHRSGAGGNGPQVKPLGDEDHFGERTERIAVFQRTKMCKFHILGACTKGQGCRFAHDRTELQALPDLQRTKLCKTLIATGECNNTACRYAHNRDELRPTPNNTPAPQMQKGSRKPKDSPLAQAAMPVPDPAKQKPTLHQAAFDTAMQTAFLQVGQAAQAHALEAARLQALMAQLQSSTVPAANTAPYFAGANPAGLQALGQHLGQYDRGMVDAATHDMLLGLGPAAPVVPEKDDHADRRPDEKKHPVAECPVGGPKPGFDLAMSRVRRESPMQILPETLRSMSSNDLQALLADEEQTSPTQQMQKSPSEASRQHRGSFVTVVEDTASQGLEVGSHPEEEQPVRIALAANLGGATGEPAEVAAGSELQHTSRAGQPAPDLGCGEGAPHLPAEAESCMDDPNDAAIEGPVPDAGCDSRADAETQEELPMDENSNRRSRIPSLVDTFSVTGITVKNTFLEFETQEPVKTLRAVQTASGRLDLMWQE